LAGIDLVERGEERAQRSRDPLRIRAPVVDIDFLRLLSSPRRVAAAERAILAALEWGPDQPVLVWSQR
jgi:hypothetical protein